MGWIAVIVRSLEAFKQTLTDYVGGEAALQALQRQGTAACLQMQPKKKAKKKGSKDAAASADTPPPKPPPKPRKCSNCGVLLKGHACPHKQPRKKARQQAE